MSDLEAFYRVYLKSEFERRKLTNRKYSQRAFARDLRLDHGHLSKLMSGKLLLSLDVADSIARLLKLDPQIRAQFLLSAADEQKCHALYLIDPTLTDCDSEKHETNTLP